ncbi:MAG: arginase family protein [Anaerosomatales bacterium]|nr:arginase family protein [Anaerosomatales bacterium]
MTGSRLPHNPHWPRASEWLEVPPATAPAGGDLGVLGIPAHATSLSPSNAHTTPAAVREALRRYSPFSWDADLDLGALSAVDLGDVDDPDGDGGEARVSLAAADASRSFPVLLGIGGDNSITYSLMLGMAGDALGEWGLITVDAHHDLRDGANNGSPVRRLIEAGVPGAHVVQIGITDFVNSAFYADRARQYGITVISRSELRHRSPADIAEQALAVAGRGGRPVFVDLDVDVCNRSVAPACPASAPGGISADELRQLARALARDPRVRGLDITEVDATADAADGRTVRLAALLVLEVAAGIAQRGDSA